jgi:hypothetical protein
MHPAARLSVQTIHSQHLTNTNAAWQVLLAIAQAASKKYGVRPDEVMLGASFYYLSCTLTNAYGTFMSMGFGILQ